jgi:hypothetical protein
MAVVQADVVRIAPELTSLAAGDFTAAIADALLEQDANTWGAMLDLGTKWLAAHKLGVSHPELVQVTPIRAYEQMGGSDRGALGTTRYGVEFARIRRLLGTSIAVIT